MIWIPKVRDAAAGVVDYFFTCASLIFARTVTYLFLCWLLSLVPVVGPSVEAGLYYLHPTEFANLPAVGALVGFAFGLWDSRRPD